MYKSQAGIVTRRAARQAINLDGQAGVVER